ncbi:Nuclear transcription factor Y subunit B-6 [Senna tora]|uniref:Nuclear transcription factor Y subunit B-6 n=1 Tax=Senna tora TaxID=362788 RepID=A0A835C7N5_9FABA|nr:Nuclear transcription factor Y subunit B-6 [Senna tora]
MEIPATQNQDVDATYAGINEEQLAPHIVVREPIHYIPLANLRDFQNLGFNDYVEPLTTFLSRLRESEGGHYTAHGLNTLAPQHLPTLPPMSQPLVSPSEGHFLLDPNLNMMGGSFHSGGLGGNTLSNAPINDNLSN